MKTKSLTDRHYEDVIDSDSRTGIMLAYRVDCTKDNDANGHSKRKGLELSSIVRS